MKEANAQRQREIEALERDITELSRLTEPSDATAEEIGRIRREVHYVKVLLDGIFGRESFQNEIIWAYDYGARATKRWPAKHDNILWYAKDPARYTFHLDESDRIRVPQRVIAKGVDTHHN